jgi:hypothetical protein
MTNSQKRRFRMLCRELAKLVKEVRKEGHPEARIYLNGDVLQIGPGTGVREGCWEAERINP